MERKYTTKLCRSTLFQFVLYEEKATENRITDTGSVESSGSVRSHRDELITPHDTSSN